MNDKKKLEIAMRAKVGLCWLRTTEELRVQRIVTEVAAELDYRVVVWTSTKGIVDPEEDSASRRETRDPAKALETLLEMPGRVVGLFLDLGTWLKDPMTLRTAKDVHRKLTTLEKSEAKQVVIVDVDAPPEGLIGASVIEWSLPDRDTMDKVLDAFCEFVDKDAVSNIKKNDNRNKVVSAMLGLTTEDAASALSRSIAASGKFDPLLIAREKERVVKGSGLEWYEPDPRGLEGVGGLDSLKAWLVERRSGFTKAARDYGLPTPRGVLLLGIPGGGKSLVSKCIASAWDLPLLRMDVGALFSKYVGESEGKIRRALSTAETVSPCILWLDEIEKAFAGSSGETDGGTSSRVFGTFLTWMQERQEGVFIIATSNDITKLPPEFLRAGRWDDIWFVDLPLNGERVAITEVMKEKFKNCGKVKSDVVAENSKESTGAEIEQAFIEAMFTAFSDKAREVKTKDVVHALKTRVPLSKTMGEKLDALRKWAKGRARTATAPEQTKKTTRRAIE